MPMFDYKGQDARAIAAQAWTLATYTSGAATLGTLYNIPGALLGDGNSFLLPNGWRELDARTLNVNPSNVDWTSSFTGGNVPGAQAKVFGRYDDSGHLNKMAFSIAGTNSLVDMLGWPAMIDHSYIHGFDYLLNAVKHYAIDHALTGKDIVVTGYSQGGGVTNDMYVAKDTLADGFFKHSDYFGMESPLASNADGIINFGFENDVVHRLVGDNTNLLSVVGNALIRGSDANYTSSTNNVVLYDDIYALTSSPHGWFSVINPLGWVAHIEGLLINPIQRIAESTFYDYIDRDSTVIISALDPISRNVMWVSDKESATSNHFGTPAFLLGTDSGDKLQDGSSDDFLDGFAGNDSFRLSTGTDVVAGGSGDDTVYLKGKAADYEAIRLDDGTLFLNDTTGRYGLKELHDVEHVQFEPNLTTSAGPLSFMTNIANSLAQLSPPTYSVGHDKLDFEGWFGADKTYSKAIIGNQSGDTLIGTAGRDLIFGGAGNDKISGGDGNDLLHGGGGNDILWGGNGNDQLYGGAGNDILIGGKGDDVLSGGVGSDRFVFEGPGFGNDRVTDFNIHKGDHDVLVFAKSLFASPEAVINASTQHGNDTVILAIGGSVTLVGFQQDRLNTDMISLY